MAANPSLEASPAVDDWIAVDGDGRIHVRTGKVDIGQHISTAVAIIAAEELEVAVADVIVDARRTGLSPDEGFTSGSNSIEQTGHAVRRAAATARRHLLALAARHLDAPVETLDIGDGLIRDPAGNRSVGYGELVGCRPFGIPVDEDVPLKSPETYRHIGKPHSDPHMTDLVTGRHQYVHDMVLDGMWHARTVHPPHSEAYLAALDQSIYGRLETEGFVLVRDGSFLAVAGAEEFGVTRAAERLAAAATWDNGKGLDETDVFAMLTGNERLSLPVVDGVPHTAPVPDLPPPPANAAETLDARYERPYQMHASIGPSAAMAHIVDGRLTVWTHSQGIYPVRQSIAEALGIDVGDVVLHHVSGAGCYGHNGADDAAFEAALVARALPGRPILLKWTRDDEHAWEPYATAMAVKLRASLDGDGRVIQWSADAYSDTHVRRPRAGPGKAGPARLLTSRFRDPPTEPFVPQPNLARHGGIHRNLDPYYSFAGRRLVKHLVRGLPLRTSSTRCLGAIANVFALECFVDELAGAAAIDPLRFRLDHLDDARACEVLTAAADAIGWRAVDREDGHGQGIAFARYKNALSYAAVAVELEVSDAADVRLRRTVIAADAGEVIDPEGLASQLEGGFIQAASWALCEQVTYDRDGITSRDWDTYPILRFDNVPDIEVKIIDRPGSKSLGAGEAACGPAVAAIANAIHDATTLRLRRMPFNSEALRTAAINA